MVFVGGCLDERKHYIETLDKEIRAKKRRIASLELAEKELEAKVQAHNLHVFLMEADSWGKVQEDLQGLTEKLYALEGEVEGYATDWVCPKGAEMEEMVKKGKTRAIGVSNCSEKILEQLLPTATIVPAVDQLELHLYNPQHELLSYLQSKGIVAQAYSPLGSTGSPLLQDETAQAIAKKHGLQTADVLLGWLGKYYMLRVRLRKPHS